MIFVIWPCLTRKWGFSIFRWTLLNSVLTFPKFEASPLIKNLLTLSLVIWRVTNNSSFPSYPVGLKLLSRHLNLIETDAFSIPEHPSL